MKRRTLGVIVFAFALILANAASAAVWYVDRGAGAGGNGTSWTTAFRTIQQAVNASSPGDEAWVKSGTYSLTSTINVNRPIALYGGFAGTETQRDQRNWKTRVTRIDGNNTVQCLHVTANNVRIDGFTITKGYTTASGAGMQVGLWNAGLIYTTVENCTFTNNNVPSDHGGAIFNDEANLTVINCTFSGNTAYRRGGAIYNPSIGTMDIVNSTFTGNSAGSGGAMLIRSAPSSVTIVDSTFSNNTADQDGGAIVSDPNTLIDSCRFLGNTAGRYGTVATFGDFDRTFVLVNSIFADNSVQYGGGLCINGSSGDLGTVVVTNCTFTGNTASLSGGAVLSRKPLGPSSVFAVTNSILWGDGPNEIAVLGSGGLPAVRYSNVDQGGYAGSNGNIRQDPLLNAQYRLTSASPCIDAGDDAAPYLPLTDIDGRERIQDGNYDGTAVVDMGAHEFTPFPWWFASTIPSERFSAQDAGDSQAFNWLGMILLPLAVVVYARLRRRN